MSTDLLSLGYNPAIKHSHALGEINSILPSSWKLNDRTDSFSLAYEPNEIVFAMMIAPNSHACKEKKKGEHGRV